MLSIWPYLRDETYADLLTIAHMPPHFHPFVWGNKKLLHKQYPQDALASLVATPGLILSYLSWNIAHTLPIGNTYRYAFPQYALEYSKTGTVADHGANNLLKKAHEEALKTRLEELNLPGDFTKQQVDAYWAVHSRPVQSAFNRLLTAVTSKAVDDYQQIFPILIPNLFDEPGKPTGIMRHHWLTFFQHAYAHYVPWEAMELLPPGTITGWFLDAAESMKDSGDRPLQQRFDLDIGQRAQHELNNPDNVEIRRFAVIWYAIASLRGARVASDQLEPCTRFYTKHFGSPAAPHSESKLVQCANAGVLLNDTPPNALSIPLKLRLSFPKKKQTAEEIQAYVAHYPNHPHISLSAYVAAVEAGDDAVELAWLDKSYQLTGERITAEQYKTDYGEAPEQEVLINGNIYIMRKKNDYSRCYRSKPVDDAIVWAAFLPRVVIALLMTAVQVVMLAIQLVITLLLAIPSALVFYVWEPLTTPEGLCGLSSLAVMLGAGLVVQAYTMWLPPFAVAYQAAVSAIVAMGWSSASVSVFIQTSCVVMLVVALAWSEYSFMRLSHVKTIDDKPVLRRPLYLLCGSAAGVLLLYAAVLYPGIAAFTMGPALMAGIGLGIIALAIAGLCLVTLRLIAQAPTIQIGGLSGAGDNATSFDSLQGTWFNGPGNSLPSQPLVPSLHGH